MAKRPQARADTKKKPSGEELLLAIKSVRTACTQVLEGAERNPIFRELIDQHASAKTLKDLETVSMDLIDIQLLLQRHLGKVNRAKAKALLTQALREVASHLGEEEFTAENPAMQGVAEFLRLTFPEFIPRKGPETGGRPGKTSIMGPLRFSHYSAEDFAKVITHERVRETLYAQGGKNAAHAAEEVLHLMQTRDPDIPAAETHWFYTP